jgi:hypothetical protein
MMDRKLLEQATKSNGQPVLSVRDIQDIMRAYDKDDYTPEEAMAVLEQVGIMYADLIAKAEFLHMALSGQARITLKDGKLWLVRKSQQ